MSLKSTQSPTQESVDVAPYPDSAAQWLIGVLNLLAGIVNRNEDLSRLTVTGTEYQQLSAVMDDLIYGVGDDENHPLSAAMTLVGVLMKTYEDRHFPKLVDLYPELAKKIKVELASEGSNRRASALERTETDLAAAVFFSVGFILSEAGKVEETIFAYDLALRLKSDYVDAYYNRGAVKGNLERHNAAIVDFDEVIRINPDYFDAYINRGIAKYALGRSEEARLDFQFALEFAKQQGKEDLKANVEQLLQELNTEK